MSFYPIRRINTWLTSSAFLVMHEFSTQTYDTIINLLSSALGGLTMFLLGLFTGWLLWRNTGRKALAMLEAISQEREEAIHPSGSALLTHSIFPPAPGAAKPPRRKEEWTQGVGMSEDDFASLHQAGLGSPEKIARLSDPEILVARRRWPHLAWDELRQQTRELAPNPEPVEVEAAPTKPSHALVEEELLRVADFDPKMAQRLRRAGISDRRRISKMTDDEIRIAERRWEGIHWQRIREELAATLPPEEPVYSAHDGHVEEHVSALAKDESVDSPTIESLLQAGIDTVNRIRVWTEEEFQLAQRRWPHIDWQGLRRGESSSGAFQEEASAG